MIAKKTTNLKLSSPLLALAPIAIPSAAACMTSPRMLESAFLTSLRWAPLRTLSVLARFRRGRSEERLGERMLDEEACKGDGAGEA